jgi:prepilin-type N-terminal cleavage/methylation domain-containing protein
MMSRTWPRSPGADDGFTLVELILAVLILGVISVPLGDIVFAFLRNSDATTARLLESRDVQIASAYWAQDVASIGTRSPTSPYPLTQSVETGVPYASSLFPCGTSGTTPVVTLAWDDSPAPDDTTLVRVAYVVQTVAGQGELHRLRCEGSAIALNDVTLARGLDPSTPPEVACSTACAAAPAVPKTVKLTLSLKDPKNRDNAYVVTLTGQRRQS